MIKSYDIQDNRLIEVTEAPGKVWVVTKPDEAEKEQLKTQYRLDDYNMNSMLDPDEVPRLELLEDRMLLIWKHPEHALPADIVELNVSVVGISLMREQLAFVQTLDDWTFMAREFRHVVDARDAMLGFLLLTVRHFVGHLRAIKQVSGELEKKITVSMENRHLLQMFSLSESLVYYIDAIEGNAAVLSKLRTIAAQHGFLPRQIEILDDIILESNQAARQATIYSSVLNGLMDARGTIVGNNMNVLLTNLTLINIVFLPLNLIASIGGMSEWSMMTRGMNWRVSYALFFVGMLALGYGTWLLMKTLISRQVYAFSKRKSAPQS